MFKPRRKRLTTLLVVAFSFMAASNTQAGIQINAGSIDWAGGALDLGCGVLVIGEGATVNLAAATIRAAGRVDNAGLLAVSSGSIEMSGDWINSGQFAGEGSTVRVSDECTSQNRILGESAFWNLQADGVGGQLSFQSGARQTISNALVLRGIDTSNRLSIASTSAGLPGFIELAPGGTQSIQFVDVRDSHVPETGQILAPGDPSLYGSVDSGGNWGWFLAALDAAIPVPGLSWLGMLFMIVALLIIAATRHASLPRRRS